MKYKKDLEVGDFIDEINRASEKADTIFTQLGLDRSRQWFRDDNGSYNLISEMVSMCLSDLYNGKKSSNCTRGDFKVEMVIEDKDVSLHIYFVLI